MSSSKGAQLSLVSAVLFALVAAGFAAFILFWKPSQEAPKSPPVKVLTTDQKEAMMQQLRDTAPKPAVPTNVKPIESQADASDTNAAAKLQILRNLNAQ